MNLIALAASPPAGTDSTAEAKLLNLVGQALVWRNPGLFLCFDLLLTLPLNRCGPTTYERMP